MTQGPIANKRVVNVDLILEGLKDRDSLFCAELISIYGQENFKLQQERYLSTLSKFKKLYPEAHEICISRAPGRLVISGEHLDYHHGLVINTVLSQDIIAIAAINPKSQRIILNNMDSFFRPEKINACRDIKIVPKQKKDLRWDDYCFAVITNLAKIFKKEMPGLYILIDGRPEYDGIPPGVGLSSSGGLEVSLILAICGVLGMTEYITPAEVCELCVQIESSLGFICGIQDPCGSLMGGNKIQEGRWCQIIDCSPRKDKNNRPKLKTELIKIPEDYAILILRVGAMQRTARQRNRHNIRVFEGELSAYLFYSLLKDFLKKHHPEKIKLLAIIRPPYWKASYFSHQKLTSTGLKISEEEYKSLIAKLPNDVSRNQIIAKYKSLGITATLFDKFVKNCQICGWDINSLKFNFGKNFLFVINEGKRAQSSALALKNGDMAKFFTLQRKTEEELSKYYGITNPPATKLAKSLEKSGFALSARMLGPGSGANIVVWLKEGNLEKFKNEAYKLFYDRSHKFIAMSADQKDKQIIPVIPGKSAGLLFQNLATKVIHTYAELKNLSCGIKITPDKSYKVFLTQQVFNTKNRTLFNQIKQRDVLVILDNGVPKYANKIKRYLKYYKIKHKLWIVPGGEKIKTAKELLNLCDKAIREGVGRFTLMIMVGGGAVLDTAGFAASIIHRSIPHIRIPSTLLAQADAGVGAKNAVNFAGYKNAIGTFNPAESIILDPELILTIDKRQVRSGLAECIKVAIIRDWPLFGLIEKYYDDVLHLDISKTSHAVNIIWRTVQAHIRQIATDPFEDKARRPLTFAHAWGHWLEIISHHRLLHGEAVAIGIAIDCRIALKRGLISQTTFSRVINLLIKSKLPIYDKCCDDQRKVWQGLEKYRQHQGGITIPLPKEKGEIEYTEELYFRELKETLDYLKNYTHN